MIERSDSWKSHKIIFDSSLASCRNYPGSFECTCIDGAIGDGKTCQYEADCRCLELEICSFVNQNFTCDCIEGYQKEKINKFEYDCVDIV